MFTHTVMANAEFVAGPQHGTGQEPVKQRKSAKHIYQYISFRGAGLIWVGVDGYLLYAFCYNIVWHHVRPQNRGAAIAILTLFSVINLYTAVAFVALHLWGPGRITDKYRFPSTNNPNAPFLCDENGYSLYCSECKHIKPNRTHHSGFTNTCIPTMDHLCIWVGNVVGEGNRKPFIQFVFGVLTALTLVLITLFIYQHDTLPNINGNSIALYVVCGIAFAFTFILFSQHVCYLICSHTTLEHIQYKRYGPPFINMEMPDGLRQIVQPKLNDIIIPRASPFSLGAWNNICDVMGPIYMWPFPIRGELSEPMISSKNMERLCGAAIEQHRPKEA